MGGGGGGVAGTGRCVCGGGGVKGGSMSTVTEATKTNTKQTDTSDEKAIYSHCLNNGVFLNTGT